MRVDPQGLSELAAKLAASAVAVQGSLPAEFVHPPLAPDGVSAGAAARLTSGAAVLASNFASQGADLAELASRLTQVAAGFTAQEEANAAAQASLTPATRAASMPSAPLVRPPVNPDVRPPLAAAPPAGGEALAQQMAAGSAAAGMAFGQSCQAASSAARAAADSLRQAAAWLPEVWRSTVHGESLAQVFTTRAATFDTLADDAEALESQQGKHGQGLENAQRATPSPTQFADNRQQLTVARINNARTGGAWAQRVADLMAERSRLEKDAISAHSNYLADSEQNTEPRPGTGTNPAAGVGPGGAPQPGPDGQTGSGGADLNSSAMGDDPLAGLGLDDPSLAGDPAFAQMMPTLLSAIVGGVGGALGSITQPLSSLPQQAMSAGSSAMQQLSKAVGGDGLKTPELPDISPPNLDPPSFGGGPGPGDTTPSGGGDGLPPVSGAGPMTGPPPAATAAAGTAPPLGGATASAGAAGAGMGPMGGGAPMSGMGQNPGEKDKSGAAPKKVALSARPNSEAITGRSEAPGEVAAAGTEGEEPQVPPPPRKSKIVRVVD